VGGKGPSSEEKATERQITQEQVQVAQDSDKRSQELFDMGLPGMQDAISYYTKMSTGDTGTMMKAAAPAIQSINAQSKQAKENITESMPRGGAQDLAKAEVDAQKAGQTGNLLTQAYTSSFPALASIGQGGVGLSVNEISNALAGFSGASNTESNLINQEQSGKAASMAMVTGLASTGAEAAMK